MHLALLPARLRRQPKAPRRQALSQVHDVHLNHHIPPLTPLLRDRQLQVTSLLRPLQGLRRRAFEVYDLAT